MARTAANQQSEYERKRQEKIAENQALLRNLALDAASAGLAPAAQKKSSSQSKKPKPKKPAVKKEVVDDGPRRTSARLRGIEAQSDVAKRKAEEEHEQLRQVEVAKRQRVTGDLNLGDIATVGNWNGSGNFPSITGPARPGERTFEVDSVKDTSDKELAALRERMSNLQLWEDFQPNEIKITPERIYSLGFHPTRDKPLVFAGDKLGSLGICDCSADAAIKEEAEDDDEEETYRPAITTLKIHTRTISDFQFSPHDESSLISASYDSSIRRTDLNKGVAVEIYAPTDSTMDDPISGCEMSHDDPNTVYFTTLAGAFGKHDIRTAPNNTGGTEVYQLCEKKIGGFSLNPKAPHIFSTASLDRTLKLWDLRKISGKGDWRLPALLGEHESRLSVSHAAFNGAGQVATSSYDDTIKVYGFSEAPSWKVATSLTEQQMKPKTVIPHNNQTGRWVTILRPQWQLNPQDGVQRFCIGNMNRFVDLYTSKGEQLAQLGDADLITAVPAVAKFHPSMDWVAGGTASGKLCLWM